MQWCTMMYTMCVVLFSCGNSFGVYFFWPRTKHIITLFGCGFRARGLRKSIPIERGIIIIFLPPLHVVYDTILHHALLLDDGMGDIYLRCTQTKLTAILIWIPMLYVHKNCVPDIDGAPKPDPIDAKLSNE